MAQLWKNRDLLWQFTLRNVELRHKGSHLGLAWSFLSPLLMLGLYYFVFGVIFKGGFGVEGETRADYALGIFIGLTLFHVVAETMTVSPGLIVANPNFVKKVVFPLEVLPAAQVGAGVFHTSISLSLALLGVAIFGPGLDWPAFWMPVILLPVALLALGLSWLLSALGVFLRDIGQVTQFATMALLYASAVFYPARTATEFWPLLGYNPVLVAVGQARDVLLWHQPANLLNLGYLYVCGIAASLLGLALFRKMKPAFADVL